MLPEVLGNDDPLINLVERWMLFDQWIKDHDQCLRPRFSNTLPYGRMEVIRGSTRNFVQFCSILFTQPSVAKPSKTRRKMNSVYCVHFVHEDMPISCGASPTEKAG